MPPPKETVTSMRQKQVQTTASPDSAESVKGPPLSKSRSHSAQSPRKITATIHKSSSTTAARQSPTLSQSKETAPPGTSSSIYGLVPGRTSSPSVSSFATITRVDGVGSSSFTQSETGAPSLPSNSTAYHRTADAILPDPPSWFILSIVGCLSAASFAAIILYFVNFPPTLSLGHRRRKDRRYGYHTVRGHDSDSDGGDEYSTSPRVHPHREGSSAAFTTSAQTPTLNARRRRQKTPSIDTTRRYAGLGIAVPGHLQDVAQSKVQQAPKSLDGRFSKPLPKPPHSPTPSVLQALTAPLPHARTFDNPARSAAYELRRRYPDLEDGLMPANLREQATGTGHSASKVNLLEKVGDGIEYAADKFAKLLHDQVRGDPEDGLLLPVRQSERDQVDNPYLKKAL